VGAIAGRLEDATRADSDVAEFLSFLLVSVCRNPANSAAPSIEVTPVFLNDVEDLFRSLPDGSGVQIEYPGTPPDQHEVDLCLQRDQQVLL